MGPAVILDSGPLGILANPKSSPNAIACRQWLADLQNAGRHVFVPELADYEIRRELLRRNNKKGLANLNWLAGSLNYLPLSTVAMRKAAELWADSRQRGRPTAPDQSLDGDVILAAQALTLNVPQFIVATSNIAHISRFVAADEWENIAP